MLQSSQLQSIAHNGTERLKHTASRLAQLDYAEEEDKMLYDLSVIWTPSLKTAELERILRFSSSLGYGCVALNHIINPPVPAQLSNPLPKFGTTTDSNASENNSSNSTTPTTTTTTTTKRNQLPKILHRVTVTMTDPNVFHRLPQLAQLYDILAVRPQTEKAFSAACLTMTEPSIISLDLTQQFPFHFRPKPCMTAVKRGVRFEVSYAQILTADTRGRSNFIGNLMSLVRATRGRGLIVSSEARGVLRLRGPADVVSLLAVWGLGTERATEGLGVNARGVVVNEGIRRSGFRGVVDIVQVAGKPEGEKDGDDVVAEGSKGDKKVDNTADSKKRKAGDGGSAPGEGTMSKRQAKKLRKLAMLEGNPEGKKA